MNRPFLVGQKVYLRGLEREDLGGEYFQWMNDYEVTRYLESGRMPNTVEAMKRYYSRTANSPNDVLCAIIERETDRHIGTVKLGSIDWLHRSAEFGVMVGAKDRWGRGYGTEATSLILNYGFRRLNLHKVVLGVAAEHVAAIRSYEKVGFQREGLIKQLLFIDGEYRDKVIMGITRHEFFEDRGT